MQIDSESARNLSGSLVGDFPVCRCESRVPPYEPIYTLPFIIVHVNGIMSCDSKALACHWQIDPGVRREMSF
jgi:hypothetical protein